MINEHDIKDLTEEVFAEMPEDTSSDPMEYLHTYTQTLCKILASKCDQAWYYDAANLIRKNAGIPVSLMASFSVKEKVKA